MHHTYSQQSRHCVIFCFWYTHSKMFKNNILASSSLSVRMEQLENNFDVHVTVHRVKCLTIKPTRYTNFSNLFLEWNSTCFGQFLCPSSGVFHCKHSNGTSNRFADSWWAGSGHSSSASWSWSCSQAVSRPVQHIPLLYVQWKTPDDGQRNCPKHVEFHSKNKFEKFVHLLGFIIRNWKQLYEFS